MAEIIVVHGNPGSGKSTQCELVQREGLYKYQVRHISVGDRMRDIRTGRSDSSVEDFINDPEAPSPLPDDIVNEAIFELIQPDDDSVAQTLALIDGYPRHPSAVEVFMDAVDSGKHNFLGVLVLQVSLEESITRILARGVRSGEMTDDDNLREFAETRYLQDTDTTMRALDELSQHATVLNIDANQSAESLGVDFRAAVTGLIDVVTGPH